MDRRFMEQHLSESTRDEGVFWFLTIYYCLADGSKLHILQRPAWCPACGSLVLAERVPTITELQDEIARYQTADLKTLQKWAFISDGLQVAHRILELQRYVEWRKGRQSPPRCLGCGAIDLVPLPMKGEFTNPLTGERVVVYNGGFPDTGPLPDYSPEGEQIAAPSAASPLEQA